MVIISLDGDQLTRQYERGGNGIFHDGLLMDLIASDLEQNGRSMTGNGEESVFAEGDTVEFVSASPIDGLQPGQSGIIGVYRDNPPWPRTLLQG